MQPLLVFLSILVDERLPMRVELNVADPAIILQGGETATASRLGTERERTVEYIT